MNLLQLKDKKDGVIDIDVTIHTSELDRLAGKIIEFMHKEMAELTTSQGVEVLSVALWWTQLAAYAHFGDSVANDPDYVKNSHWDDISNRDGR